MVRFMTLLPSFLAQVFRNYFSFSKQVSGRYFETGHNRLVPHSHILTIVIDSFNSVVHNNLHLKQRL